jgi:hypothetical protein
MTRALPLSAAAFIAALAFAFLSAISAKPASAVDEICHAHVCTVEGKTGVCCLYLSGSIGCTPCGAFDPE